MTGPLVVGIRHEALERYSLACRVKAWDMLDAGWSEDDLEIQDLLRDALNAQAAAVRLREGAAFHG